MELIFVRHGQGEHTLNPPLSLQIADPSLTDKGIEQSRNLHARFPLTEDDLILVSPTRRTIQTATHWNADNQTTLHIHPAIGPRMFPLLPASRALPCDTPLSIEVIQTHFPQISITMSELITWENGINAIDERHFQQIAERFTDWCRQQKKARIYAVAHDGTITAYREFLGETTVTRQDFLGETGAYAVRLSRLSKKN